jgi:hypothetical protein
MRFARSVIKGGATTQFANKVTSKGLGRCAAFLTSLNLMPTTVGYIMKNSNIPMGIDNCPNLRESMSCPN